MWNFKHFIFRLPCKSFVLSRSQLQFPVWLPDILMAGRQKTWHDTMMSTTCQIKIQIYNSKVQGCEPHNPGSNSRTDSSFTRFFYQVQWNTNYAITSTLEKANKGFNILLKENTGASRGGISKRKMRQKKRKFGRETKRARATIHIGVWRIV